MYVLGYIWMLCDYVNTIKRHRTPLILFNLWVHTVVSSFEAPTLGKHQTPVIVRAVLIVSFSPAPYR